MRDMHAPLPQSAAPPPGTHVARLPSHGHGQDTPSTIITVSLHSPARSGVARDTTGSGDDAARSPSLQALPELQGQGQGAAAQGHGSVGRDGWISRERVANAH